MHSNNHLLLPDPYYIKATVTPAHPQLRDLIAYTPESPDSVAVVCYDSVARLDLCGKLAPQYTRLRFSPSTIATGCGLIACGGQSSELALMSAMPGSDWCHQITGQIDGCINNSIFITPSLRDPAVPHLFVSNNDQTIKIFAVEGLVPDYRAAKRQRARKRGRFANRAQNTMADTSDEHMSDVNATSEAESVEEQDTFDLGGACRLAPVPQAPTLSFDTAINHCSVSKDGRRMVAVGDTNEVWLFDCMANGDFQQVHRFTASEDAAFGTDWSETGDKFAVSSQDSFVHVYDTRYLPAAGSGPSTRPPKKLAVLKSSQTGAAGAARKVKFSAQTVNSELLAFTEHRSRVQVVDARTFDAVQMLDITPEASTSSSLLPPTFSAPRSRPRPRPPSHSSRVSRPFIDNLYPASELASPHGSSTQTPEERFLARLTASHRDEEAASRSRSRNGGVWRHVRSTAELNEAEDEEGQDSDEAEIQQSYREQRNGIEAARGDQRSLVRRILAEATARSRGRRRSSSNRRGRDQAMDQDEDDDDDDDDPLDVDDEDDDDEDEEDEDHEFDGEEDDDCPPDGIDYSRFLPDPRARPRNRSDNSDHMPSTADPNQRTPARNFRVLSGYSPLANARADTNTITTGSYPIYVSTVSASLGIGSALTSGSGSAYQPNSLYFPLESTPQDVLGLDWDEQGESLFVASEERVWEWRVDGRARRSFGDWGWR